MLGWCVVSAGTCNVNLLYCLCIWLLYLWVLCWRQICAVMVAKGYISKCIHYIKEHRVKLLWMVSCFAKHWNCTVQKWEDYGNSFNIDVFKFCFIIQPLPIFNPCLFIISIQIKSSMICWEVRMRDTCYKLWNVGLTN